MSIWRGEVDSCFWPYHWDEVASLDWDVCVEGHSAFLSEIARKGGLYGHLQG